MSHFAIASPGTEVALQLGALAIFFVSIAVRLHLRGPRTVPAMTMKSVLLVLALLLGVLYYGTRTSEVRLSESALAFKVPGFYGRSIPWRNIEFEGVRIVNLEAEPSLQPKLRTNGIGLFGYRLGWHQLNDGHMAWLAVTDPKRVVLIPQRSGPTDLISATDPEGLVDQLKAIQSRFEAAASTGDDNDDSSTGAGDNDSSTSADESQSGVSSAE